MKFRHQIHCEQQRAGPEKFRLLANGKHATNLLFVGRTVHRLSKVHMGRLRSETEKETLFPEYT